MRIIAVLTVYSKKLYMALGGLTTSAKPPATQLWSENETQKGKSKSTHQHGRHVRH
jgi:hypothetical protein